MNGQLVIVRAFGGKPLVRKVWETSPKKVYVCNEENFNKLIAGEAILSPVGFPREDVFVYDLDLLNELQSDSTTWERLTLWDGSR